MRPDPSRPASDAATHPGTAPLVISRDPRVVEPVLAAGASVGIVPVVTDADAAVIRSWREAPCVIVGADLAAMVASLGLPRRTGVHVVGADPDDLVGWSVPLDASVIVVPEQSALLASVVDARNDESVGRGRLVRVVGGSGGLGASTIAAGLAQAAGRRSLGAVAVELDPCGGGLDLLFGAETVPGWRWDDLRAAGGRIESLAGHLPHVSGVDVLAMSRPSFPGTAHRPRRSDNAARIGASGAPPASAVRSVISSLTRSHRLVVVDAGPGPVTVGDQWAGTRTLLVVGASPRGIVAASARLGLLSTADVSVVVRRGVGRLIDAGSVAAAIGRPLAGVVHDDARLPRAEAAGDPPGRARGRFRRDVERLLGEVIGDD